MLSSFERREQICDIVSAYFEHKKTKYAKQCSSNDILDIVTRFYADLEQQLREAMPHTGHLFEEIFLAANWAVKEGQKQTKKADASA
jgi:hypothetical protein